jgi:uncharacterized protein YbdZ (MbtH family)/predicted MFS family arabinose efflux permease
MTPRVAPPLARNRNYQLLWVGQALSLFGFHGYAIAVPLLVLAATGSAAASGLVLGAIAAAQLVAGLPAGALADRWHRKAIMLGCEAAQALAAASVAAAVWFDAVHIGHLLAVAVVIGACAALFDPAEDASLPTVVTDEQLPTAVSMNAVRGYLGQVAGTAAGGVLFAVTRALPFLVDALTHAFAFVALSFVRLPRRAPVPRERRHLGRDIAEGVAWVWRQPAIRVTALCALALNLFFSAFYVVVLVVARTAGVSAGGIGVMAAMLGVGGVVGALLAPYLTRVLSPRASVVAVFWVLTALTPLAAVLHGGLLLAALFFAMALLPPTANAAVVTHQLLLTPDRLRGRLTSVLGLVMGASAAAGPALGGLLAEVLPGAPAVLLCAAGMAVVTVAVTVNRTLRTLSTPVADHRPHEGREEMDDDATYEVLRNDEEQYSLWPLGHEVPAGWHRVGKEGTREECTAYVDEVWTDMRPRSLRERMEADTTS